MYAVIESGGKQHRVIEGETLKLEKIEVATGETVEFDKVLMVGGDTIKIGRRGSLSFIVTVEGRSGSGRDHRRGSCREHARACQVADVCNEI